MAALPSVPGVALERALDRPATFRGRMGGDAVDVTVLAVGPDPDLRRAALAALQPLAAVGARSVVLCHDGVAVVCAARDGRLLADLPPLEPGHAAYVGIAVAQELSRFHDRGLVWGGDLSELLVGDDGSLQFPLHGVAARRLGGVRASAADDITALRTLLGRRCPELPVLPADLAGIRRKLRRTARPRPLVLAGNATGSPRRIRLARSAASAPPRRAGLTVSGASGSPRRARLVLPAVLLFGTAGAAAIGWFSARPASPHRDTAAPLVAAAGEGWRATVDALDHARAAALGGTGPVTAADAPGSPALDADQAAAAVLRERAPRTVSPIPAIQAVALVHAGPTTTLRVTDTLPAYDYVGADGAVVASVPARGPRTWTLTLVSTPDGWRLSQVS